MFFFLLICLLTPAKYKHLFFLDIISLERYVSWSCCSRFWCRPTRSRLPRTHGGTPALRCGRSGRRWRVMWPASTQSSNTLNWQGEAAKHWPTKWLTWLTSWLIIEDNNQKPEEIYQQSIDHHSCQFIPSFCLSFFMMIDHHSSLSILMHHHKSLWTIKLLNLFMKTCDDGY